MRSGSSMAYAGPAYQPEAMERSILSKGPPVDHVKITNITKPNDAAKTASRLNFRIRRWYSATQPISPPLTEVPCAASTNPLALTFHF